MPSLLKQDSFFLFFFCYRAMQSRSIQRMVGCTLQMLEAIVHISPRDTAGSEDIKAGFGVPGQQTTLSSLSYLLSFPLSSARRSLKRKSSGWVTAWVKAFLSDNKLSSNLSNFSKTISPHSFSFSFAFPLFFFFHLGMMNIHFNNPDVSILVSGSYITAALSE